MDSENNNLNDGAQQLSASDSSATEAFREESKYRDSENVYEITLIKTISNYSIQIEFLQPITVARGQNKEIELVNDLGIITIKYPGIPRGTGIYRNTEDNRDHITIPTDQEVIRELYNMLLVNEQNIENDFIEGQVAIVYYPLVITSILCYYAMYPFFVGQFSSEVLINSINIQCDLLGGYRDNEDPEVSLVADNYISFFE